MTESNLDQGLPSHMTLDLWDTTQMADIEAGDILNGKRQEMTNVGSSTFHRAKKQRLMQGSEATGPNPGQTLQNE